ncbi:hypothetical protein D5086_020765 [Populus alba]|uniref:Uncharacterized protein n=1 Tax=Populus alba TaxID=43335 RepID=A0ACC4BMN0_POPAL
MTANGGGDEMLRGSGRSYGETWRGVQRVKDVLAFGRTRAFCDDGRFKEYGAGPGCNLVCEMFALVLELNWWGAPKSNITGPRRISS